MIDFVIFWSFYDMECTTIEDDQLNQKLILDPKLVLFCMSKHYFLGLLWIDHFVACFLFEWYYSVQLKEM